MLQEIRAASPLNVFFLKRASSSGYLRETCFHMIFENAVTVYAKHSTANRKPTHKIIEHIARLLYQPTIYLFSPLTSKDSYTRNRNSPNPQTEIDDQRTIILKKQKKRKHTKIKTHLLLLTLLHLPFLPYPTLLPHQPGASIPIPISRIRHHRLSHHPALAPTTHHSPCLSVYLSCRVPASILHLTTFDFDFPFAGIVDRAAPISFSGLN